MINVVTKREIDNNIDRLLGSYDKLEKILVIPPDFTRMHSEAGYITNYIYNKLSGSCVVDILPALGTHDTMTKEECLEMFGDIPYDVFIPHNWREDVVKIGEVPSDFVSEISNGLVTNSIDVEVNKHIMDTSYDLVVSIGQVVPHEVIGMANYSKNVFVGCGGSNIINQSHMLGAVYGMENVMGKDYSPVRKVFDYAEEKFLEEINLTYILTVTTQNEGNTVVNGMFCGRERKYFEEAVKLSQELNIEILDSPVEKVVVFLDEKEFKSTWLGNKAIYRTRMTIKDGGELIIFAPGVRKFGEDKTNDELIRKYGYVGREKILKLSKVCDDLKGNLSASAHLIHGSSDDRFDITYVTKELNREEVESVGFKYMSYEEGLKRYNICEFKDGMNVLSNGEEILYISNPALGLWTSKEKFYE